MKKIPFKFTSTRLYQTPPFSALNSYAEKVDKSIQTNILSYPVIDVQDMSDSPTMSNDMYTSHNNRGYIHSKPHSSSSSKPNNMNTLTAESTSDTSTITSFPSSTNELNRRQSRQMSINYDFQFRRLVKTELQQYAQTYDNNENLKLKLSKSLSRKIEAENLIIEEINNLRPILTSEYQIYKQRFETLNSNLKYLKQFLSTKNEYIAQETRTLTELRSLRSQLVEEDIITQIDTTINKKEKLLKVETDYVAMVQSISGQ